MVYSRLRLPSRKRFRITLSNEFVIEYLLLSSSSIHPDIVDACSWINDPNQLRVRRSVRANSLMSAIFICPMDPTYRSIGFLLQSLSTKVSALAHLSSEQLSQQPHYDFGMRTIKSVLLIAGRMKRMNDPDNFCTEEDLLIQVGEHNLLGQAVVRTIGLHASQPVVLLFVSYFLIQ